MKLAGGGNYNNEMQQMAVPQKKYIEHVEVKMPSAVERVESFVKDLVPDWLYIVIFALGIWELLKLVAKKWGIQLSIKKGKK